MFLDKSILKEEAYIAEDLMATSAVSDLDRKCFAIKQVVADRTLSVEDALEAYGVSPQDYEKYACKHGL